MPWSSRPASVSPSLQTSRPLLLQIAGASECVSVAQLCPGLLVRSSCLLEDVTHADEPVDKVPLPGAGAPAPAPAEAADVPPPVRHLPFSCANSAVSEEKAECWTSCGQDVVGSKGAGTDGSVGHRYASNYDRFDKLAKQQTDIDEDLMTIMHNMYVHGDVAKKKELEEAYAKGQRKLHTGSSK